MDNSPTDGADPSSSSSEDELLDQSQQDQSADEHTDTGASGDAQDSDQQSDTEPQHGTTQENEGSDEDDGLSRFAKAQGIENLDELSEREKKLLKTAHDNQIAYRKSTQQTEEAKNAIENANTLDDDETDELDPSEVRQAELEARQARIESNLRLSEFYMKNPDARDYDKEMGEIILQEAETNGKAAARYLAADLNRLYILAKAKRGESDEKAIAEKARKEERERLRKAQEAGSDGAQASTQHQSSPKVTQEWVDNEYGPSNPEHRKMVDDAIQRGDLY